MATSYKVGYVKDGRWLVLLPEGKRVPLPPGFKYREGLFIFHPSGKIERAVRIPHPGWFNIRGIHEELVPYWIPNYGVVVPEHLSEWASKIMSREPPVSEELLSHVRRRLERAISGLRNVVSNPPKGIAVSVEVDQSSIRIWPPKRGRDIATAQATVTYSCGCVRQVVIRVVVPGQDAKVSPSRFVNELYQTTDAWCPDHAETTDYFRAKSMAKQYLSDVKALQALLEADVEQLARSAAKRPGLPHQQAEEELFSFMGRFRS